MLQTAITHPVELNSYPCLLRCVVDLVSCCHLVASDVVVRYIWEYEKSK